MESLRFLDFRGILGSSSYRQEVFGIALFLDHHSLS